MTENIDYYLKNLPEDFELLLKGLGNKFRFALALLIMDNEPLSFSEITRLTKKEKGYIVNHLKKLDLAGIIQNFLQRRKNTSDYSFYEITKYGKKIVTDIISSYNDYFKDVKKILDEKYKDSEEKDKTQNSALKLKIELPVSKKIEKNI